MMYIFIVFKRNTYMADLMESGTKSCQSRGLAVGTGKSVVGVMPILPAWPTIPMNTYVILLRIIFLAGVMLCCYVP